MDIADFDFDLPEDLIATRPAKPRSAARMLAVEAGAIKDAHVFDLPAFLRPGDRLVLNDTKVIPGRLSGARARSSAQGLTEAKIDVTLLGPSDNGAWWALLKPLKKVRIGEKIAFPNGLSAVLEDVREGRGRVRFNLQGADFDAALAQSGSMPLPPYIAAKRPADDQDREDYQTIFARESGAVAAPTASLHFDPALMQAIADRGVDISHVTLHVGAGTFLPVKVEDVTRHKMHAEWGRVSAQAAAEIAQTRRDGGRVIPVGTTALRLIETAARSGVISAWEGETDIFIYPGFSFQVSDALMTNFHLPKSTLMMLVSAFMGVDRMKAVYAHAIENRYRFFSYGDASLLMP